MRLQATSLGAARGLSLGVRQAVPDLRMLLSLLVLTVVAASGCATAVAPAVPVDAGKGLVIGSVVVELARTRKSGWDGFFESDLALRKPSFRLHFASPAAGTGPTPAPVEFKGLEPVPFLITLSPGRQVIAGVELVLYRGALGWSLGLISPADGKEFALDLEVEADPSRITYIGRIHIMLPRRVQFFSSHSRVRVTDSYESDRVAFQTLLENTPLAVRKELARPATEQ